MSNDILFPVYPWDTKRPAYMPVKSTANSAAYDLLASPKELPFIIPPRSYAMVGTNLVFDLPDDAIGLVCPRSGLAIEHGITVLNAPGVIDADYRGEVKVILHNTSDEHFNVWAAMRIAQLLVIYNSTLAPVLTAGRIETAQQTRIGGFGSTGEF